MSSHRSSKPEMIAAQARRAGAGTGAGTGTGTGVGIASIAARANLAAVRASR